MTLISNEEYLVEGAYAPLMEDNVSIRLDLTGRSDARATSWADSYSDGDSCYCASTFDHNIGNVVVDTPLGRMTVKEVCDLMGAGPHGREGRPIYNDIQCGNGPPYAANSDETECPGRTEYGKEGCKYIGPKWNFTPYPPTAVRPVSAPIKPPTKAPVKLLAGVPMKPPTRSPIKPPDRAPVIPLVVPTSNTTTVRRRYAPLMEDNVSI
jgi:hypothetical protein